MLRKYENDLVQILLCMTFAVLGWMVLAPANRYEWVVDCALIGAAIKAWLLVSLVRRRAHASGKAVEPLPGGAEKPRPRWPGRKAVASLAASCRTRPAQDAATPLAMTYRP